MFHSPRIDTLMSWLLEFCKGRQKLARPTYPPGAILLSGSCGGCVGSFSSWNISTSIASYREVLRLRGTARQERRDRVGGWRARRGGSACAVAVKGLRVSRRAKKIDLSEICLRECVWSNFSMDLAGKFAERTIRLWRFMGIQIFRNTIWELFVSVIECLKRMV